ncbi:hypothetical protein PPL_12619 [Heterostelium album PN500]|uniref:Uncharacterized protein n=1 Tax=Heterostelium pallidum (strain ATCC 26659 / Pp 5 / PN500) TaxID=670386 RepID=D3BN41_HETP5|nr:hypothetical protein PPL_12619 [Heterostelium album PN500]EFA77403.1 hypothetical protein PPL_12619 [Heterostelium album PN500]|eukprot:XP_020429532.1 hypothetical protein PPL_12619 [Heterostelium album PN500]
MTDCLNEEVEEDDCCCCLIFIRLYTILKLVAKFVFTNRNTSIDYCCGYITINWFDKS